MSWRHHHHWWHRNDWNGYGDRYYFNDISDSGYDGYYGYGRGRWDYDCMMWDS